MPCKAVWNIWIALDVKAIGKHLTMGELIMPTGSNVPTILNIHLFGGADMGQWEHMTKEAFHQQRKNIHLDEFHDFK